MAKIATLPESPYDLNIPGLTSWWRAWRGDDFVVGVEPIDQMNTSYQVVPDEFKRSITVVNLNTGEFIHGPLILSDICVMQLPDEREEAFFCETADEMINEYLSKHLVAAA